MPRNNPTLISSVSFKAVVSIRRIGGSCGTCREVRVHCGVARGDCKCGVAVKRKGILVMVMSVVKREMFVTAAFVVKT